MRTRLWLIATTLAVPLLLTFSQSAWSQQNLTQVIDNIHQNEKIYDNIEVIMNATYDIGGARRQNRRR